MEKLIGLGAAGNKAVIEAIKSGYPRECCLLINSTLRDIDSDYHDISVNIGGLRGGCGKERGVAKKITLASLSEDNTLEVLDTISEPEDETIYLVTSTEGGTGSGSTPLIAKYLNDVCGLNVIITAFTGFEDDARGLANTVEFFKELSDDYVVQIISNKKALGSSANRVRAQQTANKEFVKRLQILTAKNVIHSHNNIDETDLFKVINTPGFMTVETANIKGIKNMEQFNEITSDMIDDTLSVDFYDPQSQRIAIYMNVSDRTMEAVDFNYTIIKSKLGEPFEIFNHIQYQEAFDESISIISSGMNMPIDEIEDIYNKYMRKLHEINKKSDDFFDKLDMFESDNSSKRFDTAKRTRGNALNKKAFFAEVESDEEIIDVKDEMLKTKESFLNNQSSEDNEIV